MLPVLSVLSSRFSFSNSNYDNSNTNTNVSSHLCKILGSVNLASMAKKKSFFKSVGSPE